MILPKLQHALEVTSGIKTEKPEVFYIYLHYTTQCKRLNVETAVPLRSSKLSNVDPGW